MKWTVINQYDGNDTFEVEGDSYGEAACDALQQLGWAISKVSPDGEETEDDTPNATEQGCEAYPDAGCSTSALKGETE